VTFGCPCDFGNENGFEVNRWLSVCIAWPVPLRVSPWGCIALGLGVDGLKPGDPV
jgi:hypothetical protein